MTLAEALALAAAAEAERDRLQRLDVSDDTEGALRVRLDIARSECARLGVVAPVPVAFRDVETPPPRTIAPSYRDDTGAALERLAELEEECARLRGRMRRFDALRAELRDVEAAAAGRDPRRPGFWARLSGMWHGSSAPPEAVQPIADPSPAPAPEDEEEPRAIPSASGKDDGGEPLGRRISEAVAALTRLGGPR